MYSIGDLSHFVVRSMGNIFCYFTKATAIMVGHFIIQHQLIEESSKQKVSVVLQNVDNQYA